MILVQQLFAEFLTEQPNCISIHQFNECIFSSGHQVHSFVKSVRRIRLYVSIVCYDLRPRILWVASVCVVTIWEGVGHHEPEDQCVDN